MREFDVLTFGPIRSDQFMVNTPDFVPQVLPEVTALYDFEVPYSVPVVIGDANGLLREGRTSTDLDNAVRILVATSFKRDALYINPTQIAGETRQIVRSLLKNSSPENTAILLPGNGSRSVTRETDGLNAMLSSFDTFEISTARELKDGKVVGVIISLPEELTTALQEGRYRSFVIIEDVIATGTTLRLLRAGIMTQSATSDLSFSCFSWFCRKPTNVSGYNAILSVYEYWTRDGFPALNSLSTWLREDEKGLAVREGYKKRYASYPRGFDKQIEQIRQMTTASYEGGNP